ncbi:MAG: 4-hydroxythreonine-4-phosphate dehydrogenase PdxA [Planctomycetes bacterium]|nr:4-hydroxythreonine-4-phosphate dehydrogenase PdxA [Planctomycetota bacterium]
MGLALTCGDPAGIGPEIAVKALRALAAAERAGLRLRLVGDARVFAAAGASAEDLERVEAAGAFYAAREPAGRPSAASGAAAAAALLRAIDLALAGEVDLVVTAPVSKEALRLAGRSWPGQTEALIERSGAARGVMLFVGGGLRVALATRHVPLAEVATRLRTEEIAADLRLLASSLRQDFGLRAPRIAVAGLNPHAGEAGLFGSEEQTVLAPALAQARAEGLLVAGPLPADTLFPKHRAGEFDAVLAMYHDQGLVPVKLLSFGRGVNVTLGLPFIRTSPDHGTAYDIAGKGIASESSLLAAIRLGIRAVRHRRSALKRGARDA